MVKWFSQRSGKNKQKTEQLQDRESGDLVVLDSAQQQAPSDSLRSLLKAAIADAEQIAASIKTRAETEAEAEAARIIAQAKLEVQEIAGRAEITVQKQAEEILSTANKQAEIIEVEARQKALQFMVKAGEEMEKEVGEECGKVYSRLASSLRDLLNEGQNIEMELRGKTTKILEARSFELKGYEAILLGTFQAAVPLPETLSPVETESEPDTVIEEKVEEPVQLQEKTKRKTEEAKTTKEVQKRAKKEAKLAAKEEARRKAEEAKEAQERAKKEAKLAAEEEVIEEKVEEPVQLQEEVIEEKVEEPVQLQEEVIEEKVEEPVQLQAKVIEKKVEEPAPPILDSQTIYTGEVELSITAPVELKVVSRLYNYLQTVPELKILYTRGSWDQGTTITVVLEKSMPLISILSETPGVKVTSRLLEKRGSGMGESGVPLGGDKSGVKRVRLDLQEA